MKRLDQRVALITGAAGGLGRATALRLAREGASLCLSDRADLTEILALVQAEGARAIAAPADVTDVAAVEAMVARTVAELGALDVLVNIAGISSHGASDDIDAMEFERILRGNLTSVFICCKAALPVMRARGYGRIVNMSSILGKNGGNPRPWLDPAEQKRAGSVAYGASKAGVHALTYYLAKENARFGITVNAVAPGPIATHMTRNFPDSLRNLIPLGRMGAPEDVADAVAYLAGDSAGFVTGEVLDVNGGAWVD
ncbi:MAG: SDR family NAD(P)-dependent oxidoreductase [Ramlibacter sp.]|uniref:SDR family NAD(P)-dependent oxidoreductase n=1 Tax=Ramlibacter sp. TaxID=1917967 RepID=UPI002628A796|nr:SDR family NAD(P)-dependent oxidoreductase [Ramlibacter sp.]MDH4377734.1 SDR family NAD(P)-dependent oxidoreductase [Ramlibacter sp.]